MGMAVPPGTRDNSASKDGRVGECDARELVVDEQADFAEGALAEGRAGGESGNELIRNVVVLGMGGGG
jgi:hypothetical protein